MITDITIIFPARNEEVNLQKIIPQISTLYHRHLSEIIIVDDNSTDDTYQVALTLKKKFPLVRVIRRTSRPGVGFAIREALNHLDKKSRYILFMDTDFIANVSDIAKMIEKIKNAPAVVGSRFIKKDSLRNYPLLKLIANRTYHLLTKLLFNIRQQDLTNNFRLYNRNLVEKIKPFLVSGDFAINAEIGYYPVLMGAKIVEVPVRWQERNEKMGVSKFKILKVGPSYLKILIRLLCFHLRRQ